MSFSVNHTPQVSSPSPQIQTPTAVNAGEALEAPLATVDEPAAGEPAAAEDRNQTQLREAADFSPTDESVTFESAQASALDSDALPELAPLKVDPPLGELPSLENGRNVLRGDALQERLQALGTQATNGITALSERQEQLSSALASLPPESPEPQELTQTINDVQKAVEQLTTLQGQLSSQDPKAVAALQELLVQKDNGTAEEEPFADRLTYEKPDGSKATFDNLYGKRTDAGIRDYIARLVEETRIDGPYQSAAPEATSDVTPAEGELAEAEVAPAADEVQPQEVAEEVAEEAVEVTPEASLRAAAEAPEAAETEVILRPEQAGADSAGEVAAPETPAVPLEGAAASDALHDASAFLAAHGDVVFEFAALAAEFSRVQNAGESDVKGVEQKLNLFMNENGAELANFRSLYDKLGAADQKQVDDQITQGVRQFIEDNPDLIDLSALSSEEAQPIQLSSLYDMNWMMGNTLYSGNTTMMA